MLVNIFCLFCIPTLSDLAVGLILAINRWAYYWSTQLGKLRWRFKESILFSRGRPLILCNDRLYILCSLNFEWSVFGLFEWFIYYILVYFDGGMTATPNIFVWLRHCSHTDVLILILLFYFVSVKRCC